MYQLCQIKGVSLPIAKVITDKYKSWFELYKVLENYNTAAGCINSVTGIYHMNKMGRSKLPMKRMPDKVRYHLWSTP